MSQFNIATTIVTLNGHVVEGWSDDADALMMPDSFELFTERVGPDATAYFRTANRGGEVTLKLLPNSISAIYFVQQLTAILVDSARIRWDGSVRDVANGISATLVNGVMKQTPLGITGGAGDFANRNFMFFFDEIVPDYTNPSFTIPVVSS